MHPRFYVYTLAYPEGIPLAGKVFYVGKGQGGRIKMHEQEARGSCDCKKCEVIRGIWATGKPIRRAIIFRTDDELEAYEAERIAINVTYDNDYLVNIHHTPHVVCVGRQVEPKWGEVHKGQLETYLNTRKACEFTGVSYHGTGFLFLAEEFGLRKRVVNNVNYYRLSELQKFKEWWRVAHPEMIPPKLLSTH